jgi:putative SOS response-associated peptidase YedK
MCGRIIQHSPSSAYAELFGIEGDLGETPPRYNLAPSQPILVARTATGGKRELTYLRWGLVPTWSKGPDSRFSLINARAETLDQKPAYRGPFRYRRCLIPTEGFYEWKPEQGGKRPYLIRMRSGAPFALAGLWDHWQDPNGSELETCTIIVTEANALITPIHDRMPVILLPEVWDTWLDPHQQDSRSLRSLLVPCASEPMEAFPVSRAVNNTRNDEPSLIEPA